jgi:hypothetical protein
LLLAYAIACIARKTPPPCLSEACNPNSRCGDYDFVAVLEPDPASHIHVPVAQCNYLTPILVSRSYVFYAVTSSWLPTAFDISPYVRP